MKSIRYLISLAPVLIILHISARSATQELTPPPLPNFVELTTGIGTGGQPTDAGLRQVAEKGYKAVINLRSSSEQFDQTGEEKLALQLGLRYFVVPFAAGEPSETQALAFATLLSALKQDKVFIHCASGNRVGSLLMIYFALNENMTPEKAEQEARKAGLRSPGLVEFARQVIAHQKK